MSVLSSVVRLDPRPGKSRIVATVNLVIVSTCPDDGAEHLTPLAATDGWRFPPSTLARGFHPRRVACRGMHGSPDDPSSMHFYVTQVTGRALQAAAEKAAPLADQFDLPRYWLMQPAALDGDRFLE